MRPEVLAGIVFLISAFAALRVLVRSASLRWVGVCEGIRATRASARMAVGLFLIWWRPALPHDLIAPPLDAWAALALFILALALALTGFVRFLWLFLWLIRRPSPFGPLEHDLQDASLGVALMTLPAIAALHLWGLSAVGYLPADAVCAVLFVYGFARFLAAMPERRAGQPALPEVEEDIAAKEFSWDE
jgi:hypothetical protein